jgi:hypothetical protein
MHQGQNLFKMKSVIQFFENTRVEVIIGIQAIHLWKEKMQPQESDHQTVLLHKKFLQVLLRQQLFSPWDIQQP